MLEQHEITAGAYNNIAGPVPVSAQAIGGVAARPAPSGERPPAALDDLPPRR
ncbi:MAG: hypothetical protein V3S14_12415 [Anaerolineae bacterium]